MDGTATVEVTPQIRRQAISRTACTRCRSLKIRCSRHMPSCTRCERKRLLCSFPEPPDRKHLASLRAAGLGASPRETNVSADSRCESPLHEGVSTAGRSGRTGLPARHTSNGPQLRQDNSCSTERPAHKGRGNNNSLSSQVMDLLVSNSPLPEREIGSLLIDVYFTRVFTAALLFDHQAFMDDYRAGKVPVPVLLSVFAMASIFFCSPSSDSCAKPNGLAEFGAFHSRGKSWAEAASQIVLMSSDTPSISGICTSEILSLYWFGVGQFDRAAVHANSSRELCRILQRKASILGSSAVPERILWACWTKSCLIDLESRCINSQMPASVTQFYSHNDSLQSLPFRLEETDWMTWDESDIKTSAIYVVQAFSLWRKVREFVRQFWRQPKTTSFLATVFDMDAKLQHFYKTLPKEFKKRDLMTDNNSEKLQQNAFFVRSIYYLCEICLHSSAVPILSCSTEAYPASPEVVKLSAKTAHIHARRFIHMAREFLATTPDFTKVPAFVGHCAFFAGSLQGIIMDFQQDEDEDEARQGGLVCTLILKELKVYWPVLGCFWKELDRRFCHAPNISTSRTVEYILSSPDLREDDEDDQRIPPAFINASPNPPADVDKPFILRSYSLPEGLVIESTAKVEPTIEEPDNRPLERWEDRAGHPLESDLYEGVINAMFPLDAEVISDLSFNTSLTRPPSSRMPNTNNEGVSDENEQSRPLDAMLTDLTGQRERLWDAADISVQQRNDLFVDSSFDAIWLNWSGHSDGGEL